MQNRPSEKSVGAAAPLVTRPLLFLFQHLCPNISLPHHIHSSMYTYKTATTAPPLFIAFISFAFNFCDYMRSIVKTHEKHIIKSYSEHITFQIKSRDMPYKAT